MKKDFIKHLIYEKEKDRSFRSSAYFYKEVGEKYNIKLLKEEYGDLYRKIINYQIKKYGTCLTYRDYSRSDKGIAKIKAKQVYEQRRTKKINEKKNLKVYEEILRSDSNE